MKLYFHSPAMSAWHDAQLKNSTGTISLFPLPSFIKTVYLIWVLLHVERQMKLIQAF